MKFLYIVNYWVPFPYSEYGEVRAVIAKDEEECIQLLCNQESVLYKKYKHLIKKKVEDSKRFELKNDEPSRIILDFTT